MELFTFSVLVFGVFMVVVSSQLIVNVRNNGGDVYRETIEANTTLDSISLEFRKSDGTIVTQFIDGRNEVQVFRAVILPEEVVGQTEVQIICFVLSFAKNEFISSDAMSKLRQKNPSTIRHPEEVRSPETFEMDVLLNVAASHIVSAHIGQLCGDATATTYARSTDLRLLAQILNRDYSILQTITRPAPTSNLTSCTNLRLGSRQPCVCHYDICVGWYPCGLKYCRGKDSAGRIVNYRCGIKTCSRCRQFEFLVTAKTFCVWDEADFQPFVVDAASLRGFDDVHEFHSWKDDDPAGRPGARLGESFQWKADMRNSPVEDGGRLEHPARVNNRAMKMGDYRHNGAGGNGLAAKPTARYDDDDDD